MTPLQKAVLDHIVAYRGRHGLSPTVEEMRVHFAHASKSSVHRVLTSLLRQGHLIRWPRTPRGYEPTEPARATSCGTPPPDALVAAARRLLANLIDEDLAKGVAIVRAADLGDLDVALAELDPAEAAA